MGVVKGVAYLPHRYFESGEVSDIYGVRHQNYGELTKKTGSDTSINVFSNFSLQRYTRTIER